MADNSLSLLEQAFNETGEQLDRIANALKREKPVQNYPRYLQFMWDGYYREVIKIDSDYSITKISEEPYYGGEVFLPEIVGNECIIWWDESADGTGAIGEVDKEYDTQQLKFNLETFEITDLSYNQDSDARWIDPPST